MFVSIFSTILLTSPILMKLELPPKIFKKYSNIKFHESQLVGAMLFHADRRADMTKLLVAFRNFINAPNT